jgi:predicted permease
MLRTLSRLSDVNPGFDAAGLLALRPHPPTWRYGSVESQKDVQAHMLERVRALPMVESAGAIQLLPATAGNWIFPTYPEFVPVAANDVPSVNFRVITPDYLETMRIPLLKGRALNEADHADALPVAVVNRAFVERFWSDREPIGSKVRTFSPDSTPYTVVGVVGDVHQRSLDRQPVAEIYVAYAQLPWDATLSMIVRLRDGNPALHAATVRDAVWSVDRDIPINDLAPMETILGRSSATSRFIATLLGLFGALALVLGAVGVYGVTAYTVARRAPEFGIRLALGATRDDVLREATMRALMPVGAGVLLGLLGTLAATRLLRGMLFQVSPHDPIALGTGAFVLAMVGIAATIYPVLRATRVDPASVIRAE